MYEDETAAAFSDEDLLAAYAAILNSPVFIHHVLKIYAPHVAGGQFNLSTRYVNSVPIPDLLALTTYERTGEIVHRLAELWREEGYGGRARREMARLSESLYGEEFLRHA